MKQAVKITLSEDGRNRLNNITQSNRSEHRQVLRVKIVLLAAEGRQDIKIAEECTGLENLDS